MPDLLLLLGLRAGGLLLRRADPQAWDGAPCHPQLGAQQPWPGSWEDSQAASKQQALQHFLTRARLSTREQFPAPWKGGVERAGITGHRGIDQEHPSRCTWDTTRVSWPHMLSLGGRRVQSSDNSLQGPLDRPRAGIQTCWTESLSARLGLQACAKLSVHFTSVFGTGPSTDSDKPLGPFHWQAPNGCSAGLSPLLL